MTARMKARLAEKNKPKPPPEPGSAEWFVALSPEGKSEFANQLAATYLTQASLSCRRHTEADAMTSKGEFRRLNERRLDLIDRKYAGGLNAAEAAELETLKGKVAEYVRRIAPRDSGRPDEQHERLTALRARIAASKRAGDLQLIDTETA